MSGKWTYIGGGAVLLAAGAIAIRSDLPARLRGQSAPPPVEAMASTPAAPAQLAASPAPGDIARLTSDLAAREAEAAELRTTLAVRDAVVASLRASLADRDASVDDLELRLAASEAEVARLRHELFDLQATRSFEAKAALFTPGGEPSAARVEAIHSEAPGLDAVFDAALATPAPPPPGRAAGVEVHFEFASAQLTPGGEANALAAAVSLADIPLAAVRVIGHTDTVGGRAANRRLAVKRARTVAEALVAAGLPRDLIEVDDTGEAEPPVPTAAGVAEPLNRSVAIVPVPLPTG